MCLYRGGGLSPHGELLTRSSLGLSDTGHTSVCVSREGKDK